MNEDSNIREKSWKRDEVMNTAPLAVTLVLIVAAQIIANTEYINIENCRQQKHTLYNHSKLAISGGMVHYHLALVLQHKSNLNYNLHLLAIHLIPFSALCLYFCYHTMFLVFMLLT